MRIKQCGLFALSFVLALTACFTVFSNNTYAATAPDIQITNKLTVKDNEGNGEIDISKTWSNAFLSWDLANSVANESKMGITCPASGFSEIGEERWTPIHESFYKARENGYYAVYQSDYGSQGGKVVTVVWSENKSANFKFSYGTVPYLWGDTALWHITSADANNDENVLKSVTFSAGGSVSCDTSKWIPTSNLSKSGVAAPGNEGSNIFLSTFPAEYPPDYTGPQVPDSYVQKNKFVPNIVYTVDKKKFIGTFCQYEKCGAPPGFGHISSLNINYKITSDLTGEVVLEKSGSLKDINVAQINYEFKDYGKYTLTATYSAPIPYVQPEDQEWIKLNLPLNINGASYASNAISQECLEDGNCVEYDGQKDCSLEDGIFNQIKCEVNNYGVRLSMWFFNLFNDFAGYVIEFFYDFSVRLKSMFSVLFLPVEFVKALFNPMTEYSGSISCAGASPPYRCVWSAQWSSGGYLNFNGSMGIDWGIIEKSYPTLWTYMQWFARLIFGYGCYVYLNNYRERFIR